MRWAQMGRIAFGLVGLALLALGATMIGLAVTETPGLAREVLLEASLHLKDGEDPSVSQDEAGQAEAEARFDDRGRLTVGIENMDPARFPAGCTGTEIRAGRFGTKGIQILLLPAADPENEAGVDVTFLEAEFDPATANAGDKVEIRIRCEFNGERHETRWEGVFLPAS